MKKKILYVNHLEVAARLQKLTSLLEKVNTLYDLLWEFGIEDPEAVRNPVENVDKKLKSIVNNMEFNVDPKKLADVIGKASQYEHVVLLSAEVTKNRLLDKIVWDGEKFSISSDARKQLDEENTIFIDDKEEIRLAKKIEKFCDDYMALSDALQFNPAIRKRLLGALPVLRYEASIGRFAVNPSAFRHIMQKIKE